MVKSPKSKTVALFWNLSVSAWMVWHHTQQFHNKHYIHRAQNKHNRIIYAKQPLEEYFISIRRANQKLPIIDIVQCHTMHIAIMTKLSCHVGPRGWLVQVGYVVHSDRFIPSEKHKLTHSLYTKPLLVTH